jgi:D-lactate dehydrogenase
MIHHLFFRSLLFANRESHSLLGSFFLNPTVGAGVALGSGGTQLRKGPVYTERVLYVRVNDSGKAELVDTLGLVSTSQDDLISRLDKANSDLRMDPSIQNGATFDESYASRICQPDSSALR